MVTFNFDGAQYGELEQLLQSATDDRKCACVAISLNLLFQCLSKETLKTPSAEQRRLGVRKYSFSQRIIDVWNKFSNDCVHAIVLVLIMFKNIQAVHWIILLNRIK